MIKFFYLLLVSIFSLFFTGCSNRSLPLLKSPVEHDELVSQHVKIENWWSSYNDEQLNSLVVKALSANVDYAKTAIAVNKALFQANLAGADLLPSFSAEGSKTITKDITRGTPHLTSYSAQVKVSYEVDLWQKLANTASAKEWEYKATQFDRESARLTLLHSTIDAYFTLSFLEDSVKALTRVIHNYDRIKTVIQARHRVGKVDNLEVEQIFQTFLGAKDTLRNYQLRQIEAEKNLRLLLDFTPSTPLNINFPSIMQVGSLNPNLDVPLSVLSERPDVRAAEYRLRSAFKEIKAAEKSWLPNISLSSSIQGTSEHLKSSFSVPISLGMISIDLPFLDWNRVRLNIKISEANYDELLLEYKNSVTTSMNEVASAWANFSVQQEKVKDLKEKYDHERKISQYYQKRYDLGTGEFIDWLSALNNELSTYLSLLEAQYSLIANENTIYKVMAGKYR